MDKPKVLILGGTGIVGTATALEAKNVGYSTVIVGNSKPLRDVPEVYFVKADKNSGDYTEVIRNLNKGGFWDAVFDVISSKGEDVQRTYEALRDKTNHFFVLSTTLVYDRERYTTRQIRSEHPLVKKGFAGGYVDGKLEVEEFWRNVEDVPWTILRPYHILGSGSFLGCLPHHNRDPRLIDLILNDISIVLADGGRVPLNVVHPRDIGKIFLEAIGNSSTFGKAYNVVNPEEVIARDYYQKIGTALGKRVRIINERSEDLWSSNHGWKLTTLPHMYDISDLESDIGFIPSISLDNCITDALDNFPIFSCKKEELDVHKRMNESPDPLIPSFFKDN
jgi:nucleoside-diphosphate-sugar epimerase